MENRLIADKPKPRLIVMMGLPRSGKSFWATSQPYPNVSPDAIRLALYAQPYIPETEPLVWVMAQYMVKALFLAGHDRVILDATNTTKKRRDMWQSEDWDTFFKWITTPVDICIERARKCDFPVEVIEKMNEQFEHLDDEETAQLIE